MGVKGLLVLLFLVQLILTLEVGRQCAAIWRIEDTLKEAGQGMVGEVVRGVYWEPLRKGGK